jgi:hypothetical protein
MDRRSTWNICNLWMTDFLAVGLILRLKWRLTKMKARRFLLVNVVKIKNKYIGYSIV